MPVNLQNRPVLYEKTPVLIPAGVYPARLADVTPVATNPFGQQRIGLVFEIMEGQQAGTRLTETAALSQRGKLGELLAGMGELVGASEASIRRLIGHPCRIMVKHGTTRAGTSYASVAATLRG